MFIRQFNALLFMENVIWFTIKVIFILSRMSRIGTNYTNMIENIRVIRDNISLYKAYDRRIYEIVILFSNMTI